MKKIYLIVLTFFFSAGTTIFAQRKTSSGIDVSQHNCVDLNKNAPEQEIKNANEQYHQLMLQRDPQWDEKRAGYEQALQNFITNKRSDPTAQSVVTIPVVVHIIYNTAVENIPDNQVFSQMLVLNEDYSRQNADTVNTPAPFRPLATNTGIQFCLAQRDPNGNLTTGIERRQTTVTQFSTNDAVKYYSQGGMDQWDPTRYFNIWVCNTGGVCYGEFPLSNTTATYGVVMNYFYFGSNYTIYGTFPVLYATYDRGRVNDHEIGHCLNLYHIWGDDGTACTGTDFCADTPNQAGPSSGCLTFPHTDSCTSTGNGIMFEDYMDYSNNDCENMFTLGQSARMNAVLSISPYNALAISNACTPVVTNDNSGISSIIKPNGNICTTTFSPIVLLKNFGVNVLTSCVITYRLDLSAPVIYSWSGNLASLDTMSVTLNSLTTTGGAHTLKSFTTLPNGNADSQPSNDQTIINFTVLGAGTPLPLTEGFESPFFAPAGWTIYNPDTLNTWARTTQVSSLGSACAKMDNLNYTYGQGQVDEMEMKPIDLTAVSNPGMSFDIAYTYYHQTNPTVLNYTDTLTILISTDCGQTFSNLYYKGGIQLATATPVPNGPEFIPTPSDWQTKIISLSAYQSANNAIIKFRNTSGWGNQMYIDNINITNNVGIETLDLNSSVNIYPNPSDGQLFVDLNFASSENVEIKIYDVLGRTISALKKNDIVNENLNIDLSGNESGIYFVKVTTINNSDNYREITKKIILDKK